MSIITFNALGWSNLICLFYGAADISEEGASKDSAHLVLVCPLGAL